MVTSAFFYCERDLNRAPGTGERVSKRQGPGGALTRSDTPRQRRHEAKGKSAHGDYCRGECRRTNLSLYILLSVFIGIISLSSDILPPKNTSRKSVHRNSIRENLPVKEKDCPKCFSRSDSLFLGDRRGEVRGRGVYGRPCRSRSGGVWPAAPIAVGWAHDRPRRSRSVGA